MPVTVETIIISYIASVIGILVGGVTGSYFWRKSSTIEKEYGEKIQTIKIRKLTIYNEEKKKHFKLFLPEFDPDDEGESPKLLIIHPKWEKEDTCFNNYLMKLLIGTVVY